MEDVYKDGLGGSGRRQGSSGPRRSDVGGFEGEVEIVNQLVSYKPEELT